MTILNEIAEYTKKRYIEQEKVVPFEEIKSKARKMDSNTGFPFEKALAKEGLSYICEVKKASPSKGVIAEKFPYKEIAKDYEKAGASAISCLTEPKYFKGKNLYLEEISKEVSIPILRKDFTVCAYQIYEAKVIGASAILLICAILTEEEIKEYLDIATSLGLSALVEAHTEEEVKNFKSYLFTKTVRFLLLQAVVSQDVLRNKFCFVPDLGKYDRIYTDKYLCEKWNITDDEWKYIDSRIK